MTLNILVDTLYPADTCYPFCPFGAYVLDSYVDIAVSTYETRTTSTMGLNI